MEIWGKQPPGGGSSKCKGPEAQVSLVGQGSRKENTMVEPRKKRVSSRDRHLLEPQSVFGDISVSGCRVQQPGASLTPKYFSGPQEGKAKPHR